MKRLIPLVTALALTFGAVTAFSAPSKATTAKSTKAPKTKKSTKS